MIFRVYEDLGDQYIELDDEAIDYLEEGLAALRDMPPGAGIETPAISVDGVGALKLQRAAE